MKRQGLIASALVALLAFGCTKKDKAADGSGSATQGIVGNEILIGEFGSLTGSEATFGTMTNMGIRLAIKQVNAAGGVKGKQLKLITMDNQGKSEEAATSVTKLVTQEKVMAVLGEVASSRSLAAAPIAQQYKVPMISPSSTNPKVTEVGDYIFRVCFIDPFQGTVMAKFAADHLKAKKVAILTDVKSDYSTGLAQYFKQEFTSKGGEIVAEQSYQSGDIDFKGQLTGIKASKPDAIFVPGYYTEVGLIARQARQLGLKQPLMGGDGWDSSKLFEIGKEAINGGYFSNHYTTESDDPTVKTFIEQFKAEYGGQVPDGLAAMGYDAAKVLIDSLNRATELTPKALRDAIAATKDFAGVTGKITLNEQRNAVKAAVVVQVDGTRNRYITTVQP